MENKKQLKVILTSLIVLVIVVVSVLSYFLSTKKYELTSINKEAKEKLSGESTKITFTMTFSEGFEGTFLPTGWNGTGWNRTGTKKNSGNYSALSSINNTNQNENYINMIDVSLTDANSFSFYYLGHNGNKNTRLNIYIKNSSINSGDSVLITSLTPQKDLWQQAFIEFPAAYNNTEHNQIYFAVPKDNAGGNDKIYIDDVSSSFPMPVKMESFTFNVKENEVNLIWKTSSESNNKGFDIERNSGNNWIKVGYIQSKLTKSYSFTDKGVQTGKYNYRLKQIDINGNFEYHNLNTLVEVGVPGKYYLSQNYPNPFNPVTKINYQIPKEEMVVLKVFDIRGREIVTLVNERKPAGYYIVEIKENLSSGTYVYKLNAGSYNASKKMIVIK